MQAPNRYLETLDYVLDLLADEKPSEANLVISNFFFKNKIQITSALQNALYLTMHYQRYIDAPKAIQSRIALFLYFIREIPETNALYVKREADGGYVIAQRSA